MSLSKTVPRYRHCLCLSSRYNATESACSNRPASEEPQKMSSWSSQRRIMSISHWKLLNQLREYISKSSSEKGFAFPLGKEWVTLLQRLSPAEAEAHNSRNIKSVATVSDQGEKTPTDVVPKKPNEVLKSAEPAYSLQVLNNLKPKLAHKPSELVQSEVVPRQKPHKDLISKTSINSRTRHVISSIATAESNQSKLKRLEDLISHLTQYSEAKHLAVKEGAIRLLLQLRSQTKDEQIHAALREAFAILGHFDPVPGRGIRILSIDGGGIRGVLVIELLRKLEELTGKPIHEMFDYICGVSTGAILLCVLVPQKKTLTELSIMYKELSTRIFTQSAFWGTSNLVWSHSYYDTNMWEELLRKYIGEDPLMKTARDPLMPKLSVVSAVVNLPRVTAYVFRNYSLPYKVQSPYLGGSNYQLWQAVRASAAAPSYFEECRLGEYLHQDGGLLVNNPTAVAIHEAKQLWPDSPLQCVVSFGTGRTIPIVKNEESASGSSSWKTKFFKILDSATDTEAVHTMLNDLLPSNTYFRFNPYVTEMVTMDEIRPDKIGQLEQDAEMYYRRNEEMFQEAARALSDKATYFQNAQNWINLQRELLGIK